MREIITLSLGSCGNNMAESFWNLIHQEHDLDSTGKHISSTPIQKNRIDTYFTPAYNESYWYPRTIWADLDTGTVDRIRGGEIGRLVNPDLTITGRASAGNNWAVGHYTEGAEIIDIILDKARKQAEKCESLHGFQMMHSLGGGTGSGLGSLILSKVREEYPGDILTTFSVIPS